MRINFGLAILALAVSLVLWILVVNDQNPERIDTLDVPIPIEITDTPPGLVVMSNIDPVRFRLRAPRDKWTGLQASNFRAYVDLSQVRAGIQQVPVRAESSDPQVRVLEVIPAMASVRLDEIQERTVPVKVNLLGNVPFGYVYGTPSVDPEVVTVSGPSSVVQTVESVGVDVRVDGVTVDIDSSYQPIPMDATAAPVRNIRTTPQTVRARVPVTQQVSYKQVGVRAAIEGEAAPGYWIRSVNVEPSAVTVVGDPGVLGRIDYLDTAPLDVSGASSSITRDLRIQIPEGASSIQQQTARVTVTVSALDASQTVRIAPAVVNLNPSLRVVSAPTSVEVTLQGPAPAMSAVTLDQVRAMLNADGLGEGSHNVNPSITTPQGISVAAVSPESITLVLGPIATPTPAATATPTPGPTPDEATLPSPAAVADVGSG